MFEQLQELSLGAVARLLAFFYDLPVVGGSYGGAIMLLTLTVMVLLMPLTLKATRSTIKMTQMQPKMRQLQKKYKDDKQALNAEMMALYQAEGVNPVGGCLPMLAQLPVFLILFNVLRGLTRRISEKPYFHVADRAHELAGRPTTVSENFDPAYLDHSSKLYTDLTQTDTMDFGPFDLGLSTWDVVQSDFVKAIPYLILIAFVVGSSYYQQRQISARRGDTTNDEMTQQQRTQQQLLKVLPLMSGAWSFVFPTGLVLYWATSNTFRIGQQAYITRSLYTGDGLGAQMIRQQQEEKTKDKDKDGSDDDDDADAAEKSSSSGRRSGAKSGSRKSPASNGSKAGAGKPGAAGSGATASNGDGHDDDTEPVAVGSARDREERWARRRAQRAKIKQRRSDSSSSGTTSSRVTPKGTKPSGSKKSKRKR
jgi:YidC/Oxa1 family membrane protein insertase